MSAYFLFDNVEVTDPDGLARHAEGAARTVAEHGGRYLAVASEPNVVEGDPVLTAPVLIEFPDLGAARTWYNSPEYQPLKELRHGREAGRQRLRDVHAANVIEGGPTGKFNPAVATMMASRFGNAEMTEQKIELPPRSGRPRDAVEARDEPGRSARRR